MSQWLLAAASAPVVVLALMFAAILVNAARGENLLWRTEPLNLSEAAALRDRGEVARQLLAGADPRAPMEVRGGFLYTETVILSAFEAAALANRPDILQLFINFGSPLDPDTWQQLWCRAPSLRMKAFLERVRPDGAKPFCVTSPQPSSMG